MSGAELTLYYDGRCGFCRTEMSRLRRWDGAGRLRFTDIAAPDFSPLPVGASMQALNTEMHALSADGRLLVGIDSLLAAYTLVGRGWMVAPLRWRALRPVFSAMYRSFARNRYLISRLLGRSVCADGVCTGRHPFG
jgi:predicted DCC family thiol-disulfide oxidoreductase YuxK